MISTALLLKVVVASSTSVARVALVMLAGVVLSRRSILTGSARRSIAELSTYCLLPALLFLKVSAAVSRAGPQILHWLVLPAYSLFHCFLGLSLGTAACRARRWWRGGEAAHRPRPVFSPMTSADMEDVELGEDAEDDADEALLEALVLMCAAFPNSGGLPLALVDALCSSSAQRILGGEDCLDATVGYVSFYIAVMNPLQWFICPRLLRTNRGEALVSADAAAKEPAAAPATGWRACGAAVGRALKTLAPPVWGAVTGAALGAIPGARDAVLGKAEAPTVLGGAVALVSAAAVPVGIINLGGSVASKMGKGDGSVSMPWSLVAIALALRLAVVPVISSGVTIALRRLAVVPRADPALSLVLFLESTPPPAMQCMIFCQLFSQAAERPLGKVLVAQYGASLATLTAWIALFLTLLGQDE